MNPAAIKLIVGLGNPGPDYAKTRHNAGFWFIERLCEAYRISLKAESKFKAIAGSHDDTPPFRVLMPQTFMNLSGQSVQAIAHFYKIQPSEILVAHDELDLPPGAARLKFDGGIAGHNGLRDIVARLGTPQFYRLRLGIGRPQHAKQVHDYVLTRPSIDEHDKIENAIHDALRVLPLLCNSQFENAMNQLHTSK